MTASILDRTIPDGDCLIWQGAVQTKGYGSVSAGRKGATQLAHRAIYEATFGTIPAGMTVDHICRTKLCMNVAHMEIVTRGENSRRKLAAQTTCKYGHPLSGDNVRMKCRRNGWTYRVCITCRRRHARESNARALLAPVPAEVAS